jgi:Domain of unknown function (DUF4412)
MIHPMKKIILSSLVFISLLYTATAQTGAVVEYKISTTQGATGSIKLFHSAAYGSRMEMQMSIPKIPNAAFSQVSITKKEKPTTTYMLDAKSKTYTTIETKPTTATTPTPVSTETYTVKIIGKEKMGLYNCTHSLVTKGTEISEYWTTTDIVEYEKYRTNENSKYMASSGEYDALVKKGAGGFIVKMIKKNTRTGDYTMELVKFEKKESPAVLFQIPADYKVAANTTMPTIPGGVDINKIQNMTDAERAKYIEELKKQYNVPPTPPTKGGN